eukprot:Unigene8260_Nuclearia_a/m.25364 Unigene8260_Nuclearia_a/g.25364  ORF Unigene8260_Nuclearia_a/g.25364 Unigene8260_Nuclearia_a/m.25364 type:complete len:498 (-) Unigene8260_Nuclearia_a:68-1561(-)
MSQQAEFVGVNARSALGWCPVHFAAMTGNLPMLQLLVRMGADVNARDEHDQYRLSVTDYFAEHGRILTADQARQMFVSPEGARVPSLGATPLHYAVLTRSEPVVRFLVEQGADPTITDRSGHTALDLAAPETAQVFGPVIDKARAAYLQSQRERERELRRKYPLEDVLKRNIVGQLGPIQSVAAAIRRRQNGWQDTDHPLVFLFLGSSGIGKTELAKQMAAYLHPNNPNGFVRIDMSEYQEKHEVAKFIGSPPGYVGHESGGQLTERLRACPNAVVLLDEVEKAHPDVLTIMLQLFDEGRLTDGKGQTIICKDAIFVMTSNLAQREIGDEGQGLREQAERQAGLTGVPTDETTALSKLFVDDVVLPILSRHFRRDEFIGRINEILFFLPFDQAEKIAIARRELQLWQKQASDRHGITLTWDDAVLDNIIRGYNMRYGARWIKHEVEKRIINQVARAHELDQVTAGGKVHVGVDDQGKIVIKCTPGEAPAPKKRSFLF